MVSLLTTSWIIDILLLLIPIALYGVYKLKKKYDYFKDRGITYYKEGFNLFNWKVLLFKETIEDNLARVYNAMSEHRYAGLPSIFGRPTFLLIDPVIVEKILINDFTYFHDRFRGGADPDINPLEPNLFNLEGQKWKTLRSKLSPAFTTGKLKWMYSQISSCTDILIESLNEKANGENFQIRDSVSCYSFDVIASCAFGIDSQSLKNPNNVFRQMGMRIFKPSVSFMIKMVLRFLFPKVVKKLKLSQLDKELTEFFCDLTKTTLQYRKDNNVSRNDFTQLLLQLKEKGYVECDADDANELEDICGANNEKIEFTDGLLAAQAFVFFIAGFEPVTTLIIYCLYELSKNHEIQSKVRDEIQRVKEERGEISYDSLKEMTYLEAIMAETLRLHPPTRLMVRTCSKPYKLDDGTIIEKDSIVMIPNYSLQRDAKYFPEPESFKPERFQNEEVSIRQGHGIYLPFGDGPRVCIARRFALLEAKITLARIIETFQIYRSNKNIEPIKRNPKTFVVDPVGGLWIKLEKIH